MPRRFASLIAVLVFGFASAVTAAVSSGEQAFEQAMNAFRAGQFTPALDGFLRARRAGMRTPALYYNLGVTYYRLKRYSDAQREFNVLLREPAWAPLAHYNLGLIAQRLDDTDRAVHHFRRAHDSATDPKLRGLAGTALARLGRPVRATGTSTLFSLAGGYDSNVTLAPDAEIVGIADNSDLFLEAIGALSHRFAGDRARGLYAFGSVQARDYLKINVFDQLGWRAGLSRDADSGRWRSSIGGYFDLVYVDGARLEHAATLDLQARRRTDGGREWGARYQYSRIDGGAGFDYLDGWQQQLLLDANLPWAGGRLSAGYRFEINDRADLESGGDFFSYSPTRHALLAAYGWRTPDGWRLQARGEYRYSRYDEPSRIGGVTATREEDRYLVGLRADARLAGAWRGFLDYSYSRNESNFSAYDYRRQQAIIGVEIER